MVKPLEPIGMLHCSHVTISSILRQLTPNALPVYDGKKLRHWPIQYFPELTLIIGNNPEVVTGSTSGFVSYLMLSPGPPWVLFWSVTPSKCEPAPRQSFAVEPGKNYYYYTSFYIDFYCFCVFVLAISGLTLTLSVNESLNMTAITVKFN